MYIPVILNCKIVNVSIKFVNYSSILFDRTLRWLNNSWGLFSY